MKIKQISSVNLQRSSTRELSSLHRRVHQLYTLAKRKHNKKVMGILKTKHRVIVNAMEKRGMKHQSELLENMNFSQLLELSFKDPQTRSKAVALMKQHDPHFHAHRAHRHEIDADKIASHPDFEHAKEVLPNAVASNFGMDHPYTKASQERTKKKKDKKKDDKNDIRSQEEKDSSAQEIMRSYVAKLIDADKEHQSGIKKHGHETHYKAYESIVRKKKNLKESIDIDQLYKIINE
jgi:hypothetical protein